MIIKDVEINVLPAGEGDCIVVYFKDQNYRILIDGGVSSTYDEYLRPYLKRLSSVGKRINLLVVTHIDRDHIEGIIRLLKENGNADDPSLVFIDEIWFNGLSTIPKEKINYDRIPEVEKGILQNMAANNYINRIDLNGIYDISYSQGECLAELIINNGYAWNKSFNGRPVIKENANEVRIDDISITILNPTIGVLKKLYNKWIGELKSRCHNPIVTDDILFDSAFEGYYLYEQESDTQLHEISRNEDIDWEKEAIKEDDSIDGSITNRSSIALLIEYKGLVLLFPGDYPIRNISNDLPDKIDVLKLPHHGSGKSIDKNFIRNKEVSYYLLSTDGKKYNHPSKTVIANIVFKSQRTKPHIIKNYDIKGLETIGVLENSYDRE